MTQLPVTPGELVQCADYLNRVSLNRWRKTTPKQVVNTVSATDLLNGEITIDAGCMMTDRKLVLEASGDMVNNTGATQASPRFALAIPAHNSIAGVTILDTGALAAVWVASVGRMGWRIVAEIMNLGAANSQWATIKVDAFGFFNAATVAFTTGEGVLQGLGGGGGLTGGGSGSGSVDTTVAFPLALNVILPVANASLDVTLKSALVKLE